MCWGPTFRSTDLSTWCYDTGSVQRAAHSPIFTTTLGTSDADACALICVGVENAHEFVLDGLTCMCFSPDRIYNETHASGSGTAEAQCSQLCAELDCVTT